MSREQAQHEAVDPNRAANKFSKNMQTASTGAVIGGMLGALGGPLGIAAGATLGGMAGGAAAASGVNDTAKEKPKGKK